MAEAAEAAEEEEAEAVAAVEAEAEAEAEAEVVALVEDVDSFSGPRRGDRLSFFGEDSDMGGNVVAAESALKSNENG